MLVLLFSLGMMHELCGFRRAAAAFIGKDHLTQVCSHLTQVCSHVTHFPKIPLFYLTSLSGGSSLPEYDVMHWCSCLIEFVGDFSFWYSKKVTQRYFSQKQSVLLYRMRYVTGLYDFPGIRYRLFFMLPTHFEPRFNPCNGSHSFIWNHTDLRVVSIDSAYRNTSEYS
jgi:hypothetical protein